MSTDSQQRTLSGMQAPEAHLIIERPNGSASNYSADPESSEYYCRECGARVTVSTSSRKEYGHATDCDYYLNVGRGQ